MTKQQAINILNGLEQCLDDYCELNDEGKSAFRMAITALELFGNSEQLPSAQPDVPDTNVGNTIYRQAAIEAMCGACSDWCDEGVCKKVSVIQKLPPAQLEQRYTEEELRVFAHGISLSLLSKRSAQHWRYDKDTATEIEFLERLYEKVGADMRGEQE